MWLEGLQAVGSLSKYNGDKRDRKNNGFKLAKQHLNLYVRHALSRGRFCTTNSLKCLTFYGGSEQQTTIFFSFS